MDDLIVVSVVRDYPLYSDLVANNTFFASAKFADFDNRVDNQYISVRYNSFLDDYDYSQEAWFVFCHEDWELLSPIADKLECADKDSLYGPIGTVFVPARNRYLLRSLGYVKILTKTEKISVFTGVHVLCSRKSIRLIASAWQFIPVWCENIICVLTSGCSLIYMLKTFA